MRIRRNARSARRAFVGRVAGTACAVLGAVMALSPTASAYGNSNFNGFAAGPPHGYLASPEVIHVSSGGAAAVTFATPVSLASFNEDAVHPAFDEWSRSTPVFFSVWKVTECTSGGSAAFLAQCGGGDTPIAIGTGGGTITEADFEADGNWTFTHQQLVYPADPAGQTATTPCDLANANTVAACQLTLSGGETATLTFVVTLTEPGYYRLAVGNNPWACNVMTSDAPVCHAVAATPAPTATATPTPPTFQPPVDEDASIGFRAVHAAAQVTAAVPAGFVPLSTGLVHVGLAGSATAAPTASGVQAVTATPASGVQAVTVTVPDTGAFTDTGSPARGLGLMLIGLILLGAARRRPRLETRTD